MSQERYRVNQPKAWLNICYPTGSLTYLFFSLSGRSPSSGILESRISSVFWSPASGSPAFRRSLTPMISAARGLAGFEFHVAESPDHTLVTVTLQTGGIL